MTTPRLPVQPVTDVQTQQPVQEQAMQQIGVSNPTQNIVIMNQTQLKGAELKQERPWSTGLCACCADIAICCCGCFCLPCLACQVSMRMGENCCVPLCVGGLLALRTKIRVKHNIQGTIDNDACIIFFCTHLAVCQMQRELNHVGI